MIIRLMVGLLLGASFWMPALCLGENIIIIKGHQFIPTQLAIPAGKKIKIIVDNQDSTVEEFESFDLNREKIVSGNKKIIVFIGPLEKGTYKYFGDFHQKTAQGIIIAQ